jgi:hypothetical protein
LLVIARKPDPAARAVLWHRRQHSLCGSGPGETWSLFLFIGRDGVDRPLADAEVGAMFLLGCPASTGPRSGADDWSDSQCMSPRFPANAVPTFGVMSRAVHRGRYLPNLGNDIPLVCSYRGRHEICTLRTHAATVGGLASTCEAGPLPFLALGLLPVRIGRFRVCPAARPQPRLALILLLFDCRPPGSDQREATAPPASQEVLG